MQLAELKRQIQNADIRSFYVFTGDEWAVQRLYINQIAKIKKADVKYIDSISQVFRTLKSSSFIKQKFVYVVRDDKDILTNEQLQNQLLNLFSESTVILILTAIDKRLKAIKKLDNIIINFDQLPQETLKKYLRREITLSDRGCEWLIELCENDYGRCLLEADKIKAYAEVTALNKDDINYDYYLKKLLEDGTIYQPPYDAIFDFVDAVLKRKIKKAYSLLDECYRIGEANLTLLSVLYTNTKQLLQVQAYEGSNIEQSTGLTYWQIKNAKERCGYSSNRELVDLLKSIQQAESGIKMGKIEDDFSINYILLNFF